MRRFRFHLLILSLSACLQAQTPSSDPQALALAAQSVTAMTGGTTISDVTLSGNANWTLGSDQQSGSVTLLVKGFGESRVDFDLSGGTRSEIRNANGDPNQGNWVGPDGVIHAIALHNCFTDSSWFFPALGSLAASGANPNLVLNYVGLENLDQASLQHIHAYTFDANFSDLQQLSAMDFYLDPQTLLPSMITFNEHPDNDQTTNILVEVMFSDYRSVNGASIPFHTQKLLNNNLVLDIQLSTVALNSGVSESNFNLQ
jgi:hypothetical protein